MTSGCHLWLFAQENSLYIDFSMWMRRESVGECGPIRKIEGTQASKCRGAHYALSNFGVVTVKRLVTEVKYRALTVFAERPCLVECGAS